jgi:hypothetical protein
VDSTGIASKLDAEDWGDLVGAYLDAASTAVTEMGGKVAKKLGDGLMVLLAILWRRRTILGLVFNTGSGLPASYQGGAFVGEHGSWDRPQFNDLMSPVA